MKKAANNYSGLSRMAMFLFMIYTAGFFAFNVIVICQSDVTHAYFSKTSKTKPDNSVGLLLQIAKQQVNKQSLLIQSQIVPGCISFVSGNSNICPLTSAITGTILNSSCSKLYRLLRIFRI